jgi:SAM-dependent methyltransferase
MRPEDFYAVYPSFRQYATPELKPKHVRQFDREFWQPTEARSNMSVLEIGCGAGLFLAYLKSKGIKHFFGLDLDAKIAEFIPADLMTHVRIVDVWEYLDLAPPHSFDRVAMFDVFEHFAPAEGVALLKKINNVLKPDGRVVMRVPNAASPWGLQYQYHDLTHKAAYNTGSLRQVALAAGFETLSFFGQQKGNGFRRTREKMLHGLLSWMLTEPPGIWSANFLAVLAPVK